VIVTAASIVIGISISIDQLFKLQELKFFTYLTIRYFQTLLKLPTFD